MATLTLDLTPQQEELLANIELDCSNLLRCYLDSRIEMQRQNDVANEIQANSNQIVEPIVEEKKGFFKTLFNL
jgi:hypothetical protein